MLRSRLSWLLLLVAFGFVFWYVDAAVYRMPLMKKTSRHVRMMRDGKWAEYRRQQQEINKSAGVLVHSENKQMMQQLSKQIGPCKRNAKVEIYDGYEFVVPITIGDPEQQFHVALDTGSANLWIPDLTCGKASCPGYCSKLVSLCTHLCPGRCCTEAPDETCESKQKFNSTGSRTYRATAGNWAIQYRRGFAVGLYGRDNVRFAPIGYYQLEIEHIWFGRATMISDAFKGLEMDGILGLGFWSTATGGIMPLMGNAWRQHLLDEPLFTVFLERKDTVLGGFLTAGGLDWDNCEFEVVYQPLSSSDRWQFTMKSISVGAYRGNATSYEVRSDTSSSYIIGSSTLINSIANELGAEYDEWNEAFLVRCCTLTKNIKLEIGDHTYEIEPDNYVVKITEDICMLALQSLESMGPAELIIGVPFMRQYCHSYDFLNKQIGFSKPRNITRLAQL